MVKIDWQERGVYWKYSGSVSGDEIIQTSTAIYSDERFDELRYKLCDFVDTDNISMSLEEVAQIACQHTAGALTNPNVKIALVGNESNLPNLALLLEKYKTYDKELSWPIELFDDLEKAHEWLAAA